MQKIIFILLFAISQVFAQSTEEKILINKLNHIQSAANAGIVSSDACSSPTKNAHLCAQAICKEEHLITSYKEMIDTINASAVTKEDQEFVIQTDVLIKELMDIEVQVKRSAAPHVQYILNGNKPPYPDTVKRIYYTINTMFKSLQVIFKERAQDKFKDKESQEGNASPKNMALDLKYNENGKIKVKIDQDLFIKKFREIDPAGFNNQELATILSSPYFKYFITGVILRVATMGEDVPALSILERDNNTNAKEILKQMAINFKSTIENGETGALLDFFFASSNKKEEVKKTANNIINGTPLTNRQLNDAISVFSFILFTNDVDKILRDKSNLYKDFDISSLLLNDIPQGYDYLKDISNLDNKKFNFEEKIQEDLNSCQSARNYALKALPTKKDIVEFESAVAGIKNNLLAKFISRFSKKTLSYLSNELDQLNFIFPISKGVYKKEMVEILRKKIEEKKRYLQRLNSDKKDDVFWLNVLQNMPSSHEDIVEYELDDNYKPTDKVRGPSPFLHEATLITCNLNQPETLNDSYWPFKTDSIFVSWNSVHSKDFGPSVLIHELGHAMSPYFKGIDGKAKAKGISDASFSQFLKVRECLNSNHGEKGAVKDDNRGDGLYTEEDWADLVSTLADNQKNVGCFLLDQKNNIYSDLSLENSSGSDPHSSGFYRALQIYFYSNGQYPKACIPFLSQTRDHYPIQNCSKHL